MAAHHTAGKFHRLVTVYNDAAPVMVAKTACPDSSGSSGQAIPFWGWL